MAESGTIEPARLEDLAGVRDLLRRAQLPEEGVEDQFPAVWLVAREGSRMVGAAGLERYEATGLLRSVVVAPEHRGRGLGRRLVEHGLAAADQEGLVDVWLLTTTAPGWFERFGFVPASRQDAPRAIQGSPEFASICPASAACLVRPGARASFPGSTRLHDHEQEHEHEHER